MDENNSHDADAAQKADSAASEWQKFCHDNGEKDAKVIAAFRDERTHVKSETFTKITDAALEDIKSIIADELQGLRVRAYLFSDDFISLSKTFRKSEEERTFLRPSIRLDKGDYLSLGWARLTAKTKVFEEGMTYDPDGRRTRSFKMKMPDGTSKRITVAYEYIRKCGVSGNYPRTLFTKEKAEWVRDVGWHTETQFQLLRKENELWRDILRKLGQIKRLQDQAMTSFTKQHDMAESSF